ncbi:hypothetical protein SNOG_09841 [Parastagonospora nodorum SN15]|uniref:Uncharacterized protein n=1 Tax=Phaeosphaeria nodorum (strain SN15 / ATCC MYA-4574 / FGSC 10173) TaxID=321614 RepID=Q0UEH3_PHANO|nr:hypothetical protein SNOG_09841 [Parastagonospora nodorum SN15]EAT83106.1 hypothetical protein SNOG_09841 [Parastagonospora nodorum SN15]
MALLGKMNINGSVYINGIAVHKSLGFHNAITP